MSIYEEIEIEDMTFDPDELIYTYPCPCGDKFRITLEELWDGEDIAKCPSCTLRIAVIFDEEDLPELPPDEDEEEEEEPAEELQTKMQTLKESNRIKQATIQVAALFVQLELLQTMLFQHLVERWTTNCRGTRQ
ncbi:Diphthamide biosynthesis protein 3 [Seminavis robusta]|uniref:Diphthamide biosynthesis protein 3 n=1 Tax=Seminavis robusta TaxID=568900 RepID=A0A9N8D8D6_9STRA|nr:Diphthamide biosynthesis protein 3 [Seminavis robusta]|eukprot:Sro1_g000720.1 Diphthamide biosynthesis protein 3 (134) ;mRNA; r:203270-204087